MDNKRLLVAVDGSANSRHTVTYVADIVGGRPNFHVGLIHLELPPRMSEWGGSENPEIEERVSAERAAIYQGMENETIEKGQALLQGLRGLLVERGIDVIALLAQFEEPMDAKSITRHILKTAAEKHYGTVVVGGHAFSWLKRLFRHHVGEELVRAGKGVSIWVVE